MGKLSTAMSIGISLKGERDKARYMSQGSDVPPASSLTQAESKAKKKARSRSRQARKNRKKNRKRR